jgi:hypothetical protein
MTELGIHKSEDEKIEIEMTEYTHLVYSNLEG